MSLQYREDWHEARQRLAAWWNGEDIGRPAMLITVPRERPVEHIPALPEPEGWVTHYSTRSMDYRVNLALRSCLYTDYCGEAVPSYASGDLAPNCLALYLGCTGIEMPGTVWCEPCITDPETAVFRVDRESFYWRFTQEAYQRTLALSRGKFLQMFPDLIEGLDTLAAMRGNRELLIDLLDRPEWVVQALRQITDRYFYYYDVLYDLIRDDVGGSVFWAWAPGRLTKLQCDFSAMISAGMFREFMMPILVEMTERVSYSMYHLDGPCALQHLDALLAIPRLTMIQWTPGAGQPETWHERWWPLYHRILDAAKRAWVWAGSKDQLLALRREFGAQSKGFLISIGAVSRAEAEELLGCMEI